MRSSRSPGRPPTSPTTPTPRRRAGARRVDAAPWLVGKAGDEQADEVSPDELFEKLKPFKDRVAEDIREDEEA